MNSQRSGDLGRKLDIGKPESAPLDKDVAGRRPEDQSALLREFADILVRAKRSWVWVWFPGILVFLAVLFLVLHFAELEVIVALLKGTKAEWLVPALVVQLGTYICAAAAWWLALSRFGHPIGLRGLVPLGVAKLFMDQAFPTGGISGTLLVVTALVHRSVPFDAAFLTLLTGLICYYAVYPLVAVVSIAILAAHHRDSIAVWLALACLLAVSVAILLSVFVLKRHGLKVLPVRLQRIGIVRSMLRAMASVPLARLRKPVLLAQTALLEAAVFLFDAMTLWIAFRAIGSHISLAVAFAAHVLGTVAATLGPVPLGLGTFEGGAVAVLVLLDVPLEVGLSAVLYSRALTFWLPMLPGLWLSRKEYLQAEAFLLIPDQKSH